MDIEELAWNNFYKTGDIQSFIEYKKIKNVYNEMNYLNNNEQINVNLEGMINEIDKS